MTLERSVSPMTTGTSRWSTASVNRLPSPGMEKIVSTITEPLTRAGRTKPASVSIGREAVERKPPQLHREDDLEEKRCPERRNRVQRVAERAGQSVPGAPGSPGGVTSRRKREERHQHESDEVDPERRLEPLADLLPHRTAVVEGQAEVPSHDVPKPPPVLAEGGPAQGVQGAGLRPGPGG